MTSDQEMFFKEQEKKIRDLLSEDSTDEWTKKFLNGLLSDLMRMKDLAQKESSR